MVQRLLFGFYKLLLVLSALSMIGAFVAIMLNIGARMFGWNIPGLDGYAGYAIAAALFLALPSTLQRDDHIRATLLLDHVKSATRKRMELGALVLGTAVSAYVAWFSVRLVWFSHVYEDVAATGDATALWIPQLSMALGCIGFAVSFAHALWSRLTGQAFFAEPSEEAAHAD